MIKYAKLIIAQSVMRIFPLVDKFISIIYIFQAVSVKNKFKLDKIYAFEYA